MPLTEITRENIVKIRTALTRHTYLDADKKPVQLSHSTINRDLAVLCSILKRCAGDTKDGVNWGMLDSCPRVPLFRLDKVDPLWVSREQAHTLLGKFPKHARGMMLMALATGRLGRGDVSLDAPQLGELARPGRRALEDAAGDGRLGHFGDADALCALKPRAPGAVRRDVCPGTCNEVANFCNESLN